MESSPVQDKWITTLSDDQEVVLCALMISSGLLSVLGSTTIIHRVVFNPKERTSYDRIMLGLSCADVISSSTYVLTPFLLPADTSQRIWAR